MLACGRRRGGVQRRCGRVLEGTPAVVVVVGGCSGDESIVESSGGWGCGRVVLR